MVKKLLLFLVFVSLSFSSDVVIKAFYNPNCSCCHKYFKILEKKGFKVERIEVSYQDLLKKKDELGIPLETRSCHTMVLKEGRFIEGHVPADGIKALMETKNARGVYSPHGVLSGAGKEEEVFYLVE